MSRLVSPLPMEELVTARGPDKREVVQALTAERVLDYFGIGHRRSGGELRFQLCPECGWRSRWDAVSVSIASGRWKCHAHDCAGDLLAMVAGYAGIDAAREFPRVVEVAAEIAGVSL